MAEVVLKVTPSLLRAADVMCARRLAREVDTEAERSGDPVNRSRLRDAFLATARDLHAELRSPTLADFDRPEHAFPELFPEEHAVLAQAGRWYARLFGERAVRYEELGLDHPTRSPRRSVRIGGWVDLVVADADGNKEVRQLELWDGRAPARDPLELESVRVALLRIARWVDHDPIRVVWADLVHGLMRERTVDLARELPALTGWFDERVAVVRARIAEPTPRAGADCGTCRFVAACAEHPTGAHGSSRRRDRLPGIVALTPTALDTWQRCPRAWHSRVVLSVPPSDAEGPTAHGQRMHDLLRFVHAQGSCRDAEHVEGVLTAHGMEDDALVRANLARHARRCPEAARAVGHEITVARFHRLPLPLFMATARIDALWVHDGMLDARDYKTGRAWFDRVADDPKGRLQAWALAPLAERRGLALRVQYDHLGADGGDDPEPFEPDLDDLQQIEEELHAIAQAMRAETGFAGVADAEVCRLCRYRSICPDSAAPSVPTSTVVDDDPNPVPA